MSSSNERSEAIRKAVEQARLELQQQQQQQQGFTTTSATTTTQTKNANINDETTKFNLQKMKLDDMNDKNNTKTILHEQKKNLHQSSSHEEKLEILTKMSVSPTKSQSSQYFAFTIQNATYNTSQKTETSIRSDASWEDITQAIAKKLPLFTEKSITHLFLVDNAGDILSPSITSAAKFFKIFPHYEPGMVFLVHVNEEIEDQQAKLLAEEEFRSRALHLTFQNSVTKVKNNVYIEVGASWETILESIAKEMVDTEPHYVSYIVVEDSDGDEISPPLNNTEKFWRFAGPNSVINGDLFVVKIDETVLEKERKEMEHQIYISNCRKILVKLVPIPAMLSISKVLKKEAIPVFVPKNSDWRQILNILTETYSENIVSSDWIDSLLLVDSEGDDLSPPIDSELIFWKVMNTYDIDSGGVFLLRLNEGAIEKYKLKKKEEEFRANAKHFKVTLESSKKNPPVDIYVPYDCSWEVLTEGVASFLGLSDPNWIDYFILLDSEHEPLSPQLNSAAKFWKLGQKLTATDNMAIHVVLKPDALKIYDEQHFLATASSFPLRLSSDRSVSGIGYATPGCKWDDIAQRIAEALHLHSGDWVSHVVLVDEEDDDVLSPPIKSDEKFWRFLSKMSSTSVFLVYQDEERVAQAIAENLRKQALERKHEEEAAAKAKVFSCVVRDSHGTSEKRNFRLQAGCNWNDILKAVSETGLIESEFIDHLQLFDSNGIALSVPITNAKLFWKFATSVELNSSSLFVVFVNHAYRATTLKKQADEARKRSMCLLYVCLSKEEKPTEILISNNASWEDIKSIVASNIESRKLLPKYIQHLLLFDIDGDQLSPIIDTSDKFWSIWPLYRVEDSMIFVAVIDEEKVKEDLQVQAQEEFLKSAKRFKFFINHEVAYGIKSVYLSPNAVWHDIITAIVGEFSLDDISWIDYIVLKDDEGDSLSKFIDNTSLFWKTAATYSYEESKYFHIILNQEAIDKTRAIQAREAFLAAAEHIPVVLINKPNQKVVIHVLLNSSWEIISDQIISEFAIETPVTVSRLILVDSDMDELSPPVNTEEKFWKIYLQNYKPGLNMSFAAYITDSPPIHKSPVSKASKSDSQIQNSPKLSNPTVRENISIVANDAPIPELNSNSKEELVPVVNDTPTGEDQPASEEDSTEDGSTPSIPENQTFFDCCGNGNVNQVKYFIEVQKIDPNTTNENLSTGLHFACSKGRLDIAKYLYQAGAHLLRRNVSGLTPFDCACIYGYIDICRWMFESGKIDLTIPPEGDAFSSLHVAATNGQQEIVEWLVTMGANVQLKSHHGTTALMEAAHNGHVNVVKYLHRNGAALDSSDEEKIRAIHLASASGHLEVVQYLETNGVAVDQPDGFGKTPFLHACSGGHLTLAKWLRDKYVNIFATGGCYDRLNTALHLAAQSGNIDLIKWLVEECHLNILARNEKNATAIDFARVAGNEEVMSYLSGQLQNGQTSDAIVLELEKALEVNDSHTAKKLLESILNSQERIQFPYNSTPLHYVAASGLIELAQYLVMSGADVNAVTNIGRTPLHYCTFTGKVDMAKYLTSVGANPRACDVNGIDCLAIAKKSQIPELISWFSHFGADPRLQGLATPSPSFSIFSCFADNSARPNPELLDYDLPETSTTSKAIQEFRPQFNPQLHQACSEGNLEEVKYLVGMGSLINIRKTIDDPTPLHCAISSGNLEVVKYLLEKGALINSQNCPTAYPSENDYAGEVMTPLHLACDRRHTEIVLLLIRNGADLHVKNRAGDTPLHIICLLGMHELLQEIINFPRSILPTLNLDVRSNHLLNLLHCAADAGSYETCLILIHEEIGINSYDDEKKTPLHYACGKGSLDVAKLLISEGAVIDLEDSSKRTPFLYACSSGNEELIKYLVDMGARVDTTTSKGNNALHIACKVGNFSLVKWLISHGVNPDQRNSHYQFPIFFANLNGYYEIVDWLQTKMVSSPADIARSLIIQDGISHD